MRWGVDALIASAALLAVVSFECTAALVDGAWAYTLSGCPPTVVKAESPAPGNPSPTLRSAHAPPSAVSPVHLLSQSRPSQRRTRSPSPSLFHQSRRVSRRAAATAPTSRALTLWRIRTRTRLLLMVRRLRPRPSTSRRASGATWSTLCPSGLRQRRCRGPRRATGIPSRRSPSCELRQRA